MIILISGASHTGKTKLAQQLLEKYKYPYLSIDHLKMGLIRSGNTELSPTSDDHELTNYLYIADMPIDNNDTEREIRNMVMGKKAYLFCKTNEACNRAALMYSLFGACRVLGKNAEKWLTYTLKYIGKTKPEDLHRLLPEEWDETLV